MTTFCKNCRNEFVGNYCNNCGQEASTQKLNFRYLWHEIQHNLLHINHGVFYSVKQLYTRPGHSIREFVEGKRVKHFQPLSLLILLASLYGFLFHYFDIDVLTNASKIGSDQEQEKLEQAMDWLGSHLSLVNVLTIPLYALGSFVAFRRQGYNFVEHLVLNAYLAAQRLCLILVLFPVLYKLSGTPDLIVYTRLMLLAEYFLLLWTYIQFFSRLNPLITFLLSLISVGIYWVLFVLVIAALQYIFHLG
jgi:hypothetical protein